MWYRQECRSRNVLWSVENGFGCTDKNFRTVFQVSTENMYRQKSRTVLQKNRERSNDREAESQSD